ncbi:MAG TPA: UDP-glucose/GDP-mannose dehydrogenase family protein [Acidimicrobiia bacterium]|nr:UDP-glucose/GDP-mannose dehydrogenase family protein [Acidimicrobiia bacterium]
MTRVGVLGAGYVGLTTAACLAHLGHNVTCADIDERKIGRLAGGDVPIREDGLEALVTDGLAAGRLHFVVGPAAGARGAELVFVCVPSPPAADGSADLSALVAAIDAIGPVLETGATVVNKSTLPVGSTRIVRQLLEQAGAAAGRFSVACNPEFLREGDAVHDFLHPNRIVVGCDDREAAEAVLNLYRDLDAPVVVTDCASAELVKYASNALLATKVAFVNSLAELCEAVDADIEEVVKGVGLDPRIGPHFLRPGPGFGGPCLPKDASALLASADALRCHFGILRAVLERNCHDGERIVEKIRRAAGGNLAGARVAVWGLAFKAGTDDTRESPALEVVERLIGEGAAVRAYDPAVSGLPGDRWNPVVVMRNLYAPCTGADVLAVLTEWPEFRRADFRRIRSLLCRPAIVDARNALDPAELTGFSYDGVGRPLTALLPEENSLAVF